MAFDDRVPLTRRGWGVLSLVLGGVVLGVLFGPRSLNAMLAPVAIAIVVATWRVRSVDRPTLHRSVPSNGTVGDSVTVSVEVEDPPQRFGRFVDELGAGLAGNEASVTTDLTDELAYTVTLTDRGLHEIGPATIVVEDLFGLASRSFTYHEPDSLIVYPRIYPVSAAGRGRIAHQTNVQLRRERHEFERLREYQPEDSLRDIHWKTSAKRADTDFIVKEFVNETDHGAVVLSGQATDAGVDALATAMASVTVALLEEGVAVGLETARGHVAPVDDLGNLNDLLYELALLDPGEPDTHGDLHFVAQTDDHQAVTLSIEDEEFPFGELLEAGSAVSIEPSGPEPDRLPTAEVAD